MQDQAGNSLQAGDDAVLLCEVVRVIEPGTPGSFAAEEPGVVVRIMNTGENMKLFISARKMPLRGLVASEELMKLQPVLAAKKEADAEFAAEKRIEEMSL